MAQKIERDQIYERLKNAKKVGVHHGRFYLKTEENWRAILPAELAVEIRRLYREEEQQYIAASTIKEIQEQLLQDPYVQLRFTDDDSEKYLCLKKGVFNTDTGRTESGNTYSFSYFLDFTYIDVNERETPSFDAYIKSVFPGETEVKRRLLLQILGYCLSDYTKAKAAFFFIGESNSGKSTMLELVKRILPEQTVTSIPLYRLENRFNLARLSESRINICPEISEKSLASADIFKMLTSNEMVTAEHKGGKPFEFRLKCKSLNAGNVLPDFKTGEGMAALVNRMVILLFPVSIPPEEQDLELLEKLYEERDSIFSEALDELVELRRQKFHFVEPKDSEKLKKQLFAQDGAAKNFILERCVLQKWEKIYLRDLYRAFQEYCEENLLECLYTKTKFSQFLAQQPGLVQKKMRIDGGKPLSGVEGIRLKICEEYETVQNQEGENFLGRKSTEQRNSGTDEKNLKNVI